MKFKFCTIALLYMIGLSFYSQAQDVITLRNGKKIEGFVTEIAANQISYKRNTGDLRVYKLDKRDVVQISYENGEVENINHRDTYIRRDGAEMIRRNGKDIPLHVLHKPEAYKNNSVRAYPVFANNHGMGVGISYERVLDKKGHMSIDLPLSYTFLIPFTSNKSPSVIGFYPNFKFYPTTSRGWVKYAIGLGIGYESGSLKTDEVVYNNQTGVYTYGLKTYNISRFGIMFTNSLNIQPTPQFNVGLELGLGPLISTDAYFTTKNSTADVPMIRAGVRFGYRF